MGKLDQLAKNVFYEETPRATQGAAEFQGPVELSLSEVRLDGTIVVRDGHGLSALPAPWSLASAVDEVVLEIKMQGDHLDRVAVERALLRRQARQVVRVEDATTAAFSTDVPIWVSAPRVPEQLRRRRALRALAPGCYAVEPSGFPFVWVAANELPLRQELLPFLISRTGRALDEFALWLKTKRFTTWMVRMVELLPMSNVVHDEVWRFMHEPNTEPEDPERKRRIVRAYLKMMPDMREELIDEGLAPLVHQFERKLGRVLSSEEHRLLRERLARLGANRLGDVVFDLGAEALGAWLADPSAT